MAIREPDVPFRWTRLDLIAFISFFIASIFFLPLLAFLLLRVFEPTLQLTLVTMPGMGAPTCNGSAGSALGRAFATAFTDLSTMCVSRVMPFNS